MSSYSLSQVYLHSSVTSTSTAFSTGSSFFAVPFQNRIIIRSTESMQVVRTYLCSNPNASHVPSSQAYMPPQSSTAMKLEQTEYEKRKAAVPEISQLMWSASSEYLMATAVKQGLVFVFAVGADGDEPTAVINCGIEGLVKTEWSMGGKGEEILCWSENGLRLSIYSLATGITSHISSPAALSSPSQPTSAYSPDFIYFALLERHGRQDCVSIYDAGDQFNLIRSFPVKTERAEGLSWSPCGRWIAVWDHCIEYNLQVYSPTSSHLLSFQPSHPTFLSSDPGLGVKTLAWGPRGDWVAVGGWDGKVRVVEADGWRCMMTIDVPMKVDGRDLAVWSETKDWWRQTRGKGVVQFDRVEAWTTIQPTKPDPKKANPKMGVCQLEWNVDGTCLLIRLEQTPNVAYIYSFLESPSSPSPGAIVPLSFLLFASPVRCARWNPRRSTRLALATLDPTKEVRVLGGRERTRSEEEREMHGGSGVYIWDASAEWVDEEDGGEVSGGGGVIEGVGIPMPGFQTHDVRWSPSGDHLSVADKEQFCVVYDALPVADDDATRAEVSIREDTEVDVKTPGVGRVVEAAYDRRLS